ncbi:hypothetical protein [Agrobacterium leguminum]
MAKSGSSTVSIQTLQHLALDKSVEKTDELSYFEGVMIELGKLFKRHVRASFDGFIHLRNELPLAKDGHRPVRAFPKLLG